MNSNRLINFKVPESGFFIINLRVATTYNRLYYLAALGFFLAFSSAASEIDIPYSFVANTPAVASQVNENFNAVKTSVDDNDLRIDLLETEVGSLQIDTLEALVQNLQTQINNQQSVINQLQNDLLMVQSNTVLSLDGVLELTQINGYDTAQFSAANVVINNGTGTTNSEVNGLGNLTIGYNEVIFQAPEFCSNPDYSTQSDCEDNGEVWSNNVRTGSHNLILGFSNSYDNYGSIISGAYNIVNGDNSSVIGGVFNAANGSYSNVFGGYINTTNGPYSQISGGANNETVGGWSGINGGAVNIALGNYSSIHGGRGNTTQGQFSSISGGNGNTAAGSDSNVSGGLNRTASGSSDWVAGSLVEDN